MIEGGILGGTGPLPTWAVILAAIVLVVCFILTIMGGVATGWSFTTSGAAQKAWQTVDETTKLTVAQQAFKDAKLTVWPATVDSVATTSAFGNKKFPQIYERSDASGFSKERLVETRSQAPHWVPSDWSISDRGDNDRAAIQGSSTIGADQPVTISGFANAQQMMAKKAGVDNALLAAYNNN